MIKVRLIKLLKDSGKYILYQIAWQWISLITQIIIVWNIAGLLEAAWNHRIVESQIIKSLIIVIIGVGIRAVCDRYYTLASFYAGADVKRILRNRIYEKILLLGPGYREQIHTSEIVQMAVDGVEQLDTYFGRYLSQFIYALLAPITLFAVICNISLKSALILLLAVPLIPVGNMLVITVAKKILSNYFDIY